jgi:hypothetical protein
MQLSSAHSTTPTHRARPRWLRPGLLWFAFDLFAPTILLYVMLWFGSSLYLAFLVSGAISAVTSLVTYRRGTSNGRFAPYMLALTIAGFAVSLVTGSDRFLLARESLLTAMVALWFFGSLWADRPLAYQFSKPLLEGRFRHGPPWELLWEHEPNFRHMWRVMSVLWAVATMSDAILRVVMAYTLPVNAVPILQQVLMFGTMLVMQPVTWIYFHKAGMWRMLNRPYAAEQRLPAS